jgi:endonuclease/exonuclease/phosphatase family metal-dependent hydrolase
MASIAGRRTFGRGTRVPRSVRPVVLRLSAFRTWHLRQPDRIGACFRACFVAALLGGAGTRSGLRAQEPSTAPATTIRVVHYNLRNWLDMERRVGGEIKGSAPKPEPEKKALIKIVAAARPDVLGVCEVGPEKDVIDLQARLKAAGIDLPHRAVHTGADAVRHLAVLSRFPIVSDQSPSNLTYRLGDQDMPFQRGILDVTLQVTPDYRLRLLGNHLKSRREVVEGDQQIMRRQEALLLRRHLEAVLAGEPDVNLLVYGDFNDTKNEQSIRIVQGQFGEKDYLRDLWLEDVDGYRFTYYWSVPDRYERIDFAFVSNGLWPEIDMKQSFIGKDEEWLKASDHRPLVMALHPVNKAKR